MEQSNNNHYILIGGGFVIPAAYFDELLSEPLRKAEITYSIIEDINKYYQGNFNFKPVLFIKINDAFYKDFLSAQRGELLYDLISNSLTLLWQMFKEIDAKEDYKLKDASVNKFDILYSAKDQNQLHFSFSFSLIANEEQQSWNQMIDLIKKYETNDEIIYKLVNGIHAQKDNIRFFNYNPNNFQWDILNPLQEETLRLSKEYYDYKKDKRIKKPHLFLTKENYKKHFVWDSDQWILHIQNIQIILAQPNDISLYISLFEKNLNDAKKIYNEEYSKRGKYPFNQLLKENETKKIYDYFENIITAVIFSYTAIEAFVNICIIDEYEYTEIKDDKPITHSKEAILKNFPLRKKLKSMLTQILQTPDPTKESWWERFINLEKTRNEIIHTKQSKSEERYSSFLTKNIFEYVEVSKEIIEFYGNYIDANLKGLLIDYPYGYGYDNVLPYFISDESYEKHWRNLHGIPENPAWEKSSEK
jgi:hypothetical protein